MSRAFLYSKLHQNLTKQARIGCLPLWCHCSHVPLPNQLSDHVVSMHLPSQALPHAGGDYQPTLRPSNLQLNPSQSPFLLTKVNTNEQDLTGFKGEKDPCPVRLFLFPTVCLEKVKRPFIGAFQYAKRAT